MMTLLVLKVIFQYMNLSKVILLMLLMFPMIIFYREVIAGGPYEYFGFSFCNVFIAYPFFLVGYILSEYCYDKVIVLSSFLERKYRCLSFLGGVAFLSLLYVFSPMNGIVYMIYGGFGNQIQRFLLYSFIGIIGVYLLAVVFSRHKCTKWGKTISSGSILILAFQGYFIERIVPRLEILTGGKNALYEYGSVMISIIIMLLFVPIIKWFQRYIPIVLGKRK